MSKKDKTIRVKLIVNPGAGNASDATENLKLVTGYLRKNGLKADAVQAKPKEKATPLARQAVKDGYKLVIAMGGDGTVEAVMRGMVGSKVRLGIVPIGVENNIAKSLGIPMNVGEACILIASDNTRKLDVGQVKTGKGKKFPFFEMVSLGFSADMLPDEGAGSDGKDLAGLQDNPPPSTQNETSPRVILTLDDGNKIEVDTMLVMASNTSVFAKKYRVTPNDSLPDGFLDISVFQDFNKADLRGYYARMNDEGYSGKGKVQHYQAHKLKVSSLPKLKVMADGIEQGKGTVTIKIRPGALRVIATEKDRELEGSLKDNGIPALAQDEQVSVPARNTDKKLPIAVSPVDELVPGE